MEGGMKSAKENLESGSNKYLWGFLALTCLLSWPVWFASGVLVRRGVGVYDFQWLLAQVGVFGPALAGLIVSGLMRKELWRNHLRLLPFLLLPLVLPGILIAQSAPSGPAEFPPLPAIVTVVVAATVALFFSPLNSRLLNPGTGKPYEKPQVKWVLLSITLFPALFLLAWAIVNLRSGEWTISTLQGGATRFGWIILVSISHNFLLGGSLGEELGWRGFLLPELLKRYRPLAASLILGVIWGLWHLPIDIYAGYGLEGLAAVPVRVMTAIALSIVFTWFYLQSKGNLLIAMILHTAANFYPDLGFSGYDLSIALLVLFIGITALIVSVSSQVFREGVQR
jgi:membrane protease YdiL (CAAX protease family)